MAAQNFRLVFTQSAWDDLEEIATVATTSTSFANCRRRASTALRPNRGPRLPNGLGYDVSL